MAVSFSRRSGSVWVQGSFSIVVFFLWQWDNTVPTSPSLSLFLTQVSPSLSSQRRSVRFLCWRPTKGKSCVRAAVSSPLLSCYSCSSLCFLALTGPWPFLREPFWGLRSCPRSWSVHGIPPCPSSLSRSESECMRAEEVGAGTGFRRAERERGEQKRKKQCDGAVLNID